LTVTILNEEDSIGWITLHEANTIISGEGVQCQHPWTPKAQL